MNKKYEDLLNKTKSEIKKLLETTDIGLKTNLNEDDDKKSFIYVTSDNVPYTVEVEVEENGEPEFYVSENNGQLIDIFKSQMLDKNGGIPSKIRNEIFNDYKTKHENSINKTETKI